MKTETKIGIVFFVLLLVGVFLFHAHLLKEQSGLIGERHYQSLKHQTVSLAELCTEAIAGGDFAFLENTMAKLRKQKDVQKAVIVEQPSNTVLASTAKGAYGKIHRDNVALNTLKVKTPIVVAGKPWATLHVTFDDAGWRAQIKSLKKILLTQAGIILLVGSVLFFVLGKLTARQYAKQNQSRNQYSDAFGLPDLSYDTIIQMPSEPLKPAPALSTEEKKIIKIIRPRKQVRDILKASPLEAHATFEHITKLIARGVISAA
jgi:hypothetical protein